MKTCQVLIRDHCVLCFLNQIDCAIIATTDRISHAWGYKQFGVVRPGQLTDLAVVEDELAVDMRCLSRVRAVFQLGRSVYSTLQVTA